MKLSETLGQTLADLAKSERLDLEGALADAERMADEFSDVNPVPYVVPIERTAGLPFKTEKNA